MSLSRSTVGTTFFCVALTLGTAQAQARDTVDLALEFAACTGRYSALLEHTWETGGQGADIHAKYDQVFDMLRAVQADAEAHGLSPMDLMMTRHRAKHALGTLLQGDPENPARATRLVRRSLAPCDALILG